MPVFQLNVSARVARCGAEGPGSSGDPGRSLAGCGKAAASPKAEPQRPACSAIYARSRFSVLRAIPDSVEWRGACSDASETTRNEEAKCSRSWWARSSR